MGQTFMYKHTYPVVIGSIYAEIEIIFGTVYCKWWLIWYDRKRSWNPDGDHASKLCHPIFYKSSNYGHLRYLRAFICAIPVPNTRYQGQRGVSLTTILHSAESAWQLFCTARSQTEHKKSLSAICCLKICLTAHLYCSFADGTGEIVNKTYVSVQFFCSFVEISFLGLWQKCCNLDICRKLAICQLMIICPTVRGLAKPFTDTF